ncbi:MAG: UDP-N-acetylmuramoyl-L-alanyl-D-glutamate--2,6-diaminopimelate ligase [Spirochaetes bacterium]|nr:UDP-N-acetylmuramoyl-L-alanyl-D-glutamate--2,6-diaminopimelate ligase [Spirochaetota bacterium]
MQKRLSALLDNCNIISIAGKKPYENNVIIEDIAYDSRMVRNNSVFFALKGIHTDGHAYLDLAIKNGASALFVSVLPSNIDDNISYIVVDDTRKEMAFFSAAFYDFPAAKLKTIGVTGTDGKSTTVSFIYQLLNMVGKKTGFISTVEYDSSGTVRKNPFRQSTPEAPEITKILWEMVSNNLEYAVIESTSHGLSAKTARLAAVRYNAAVLTNISHEHLEFHGTMENYINDKANLFRKAEDFCVVNYDEPTKSAFLAAASGVPSLSYSIKDPSADIYASAISTTESGSQFTVHCNSKELKAELCVPGAFNIENFFAAAITVSKITGINIFDVISLSKSIKSTTGRMDIVDVGQNFTVIVDYAHTPGSFTKIFPMIKKNVKNRLIAVFGSAGERDTEKRAVQGAIASEYSDVIILTDEDPRGEDPIVILDQIESGIRKDFDASAVFKICDRQMAINKAMEIAQPGDTVLLLGKGHESSIIYGNKPMPWNEKEAAIKALMCKARA